MSTVTIQAFRETLPMFADSNTFDDPTLQFWLDLGDKLHNADRWGDLLATGIQLFAAHYISVDAVMAKEAARGAPVGLRGGAIVSESGDSVSISFDNSGTNEDGAGHWNQTVWGKRYYRLMRLVGAGPVQVGAETGGVNVSSSAWAGPPYGIW